MEKPNEHGSADLPEVTDEDTAAGAGGEEGVDENAEEDGPVGNGDEDDDEDGPVGNGDEDDEDGEDDDDDGDDGEDDDDAALTGKAKLTPEQQKIVDRAMKRKQARVRKARERAEDAERELETLKAERDDLQAKVGDEAVLSAMQMAGVLPEYVTADEAKLVAEAEGLKSHKRFLARLVRAGEDYTGRDARGNERTWTVAELGDGLDSVEDRLEQIGGRAAAIKARVADAYREDLKLARETRKRGEDKPAPKAKVKPKAAKVNPPAPPKTGRRRQDDGHEREAVIDWSKVNTKEDREKLLRMEERKRAR